MILRSCYSAFMFTAFLSIAVFSSTSSAEWQQVFNIDTGIGLEGIWGSSDTNIYAISFTGKVYHCTENCNNPENNNWIDISRESIRTYDTKYQYYPFGVWGIDENNVYIVGTRITISQNQTGMDTQSAFISRYNGVNWEQINVTPPPGASIEPDWFRSVWGLSSNHIYFCGGVIKPSINGTDNIDSGIIWRYNGAGFVEEVGPYDVNLLTGSLYEQDLTLPQVQDIIGFSLENGHVELYAVGFKGLILYKNTSQSDGWSIMNINTTEPRFFRLWGYAPQGGSAENILAVGFNNNQVTSDDRRGIATIYQYKRREGISEKKWIETIIPETREGTIPSLYGVWGNVETGKYHAVGEGGTSLYLDTLNDPDNIRWQQIIGNDDPRFTDIYATSFDNAFATSGNGAIYWFNGTLNRSGLKAINATGFAPHEVNLTDISVGTVIKWEWNFGEGTLPPLPATADIDKKLLLTTPPGAQYNNIKIRVVDNGNISDTIVAPTHKTIDATPPIASLNNAIDITGIIDERLNGLSIMIKKSTKPNTSVRFDGTNLTIELDPDHATQKDVSDALTAHRFIDSATCKEAQALFTNTAMLEEEKNNSWCTFYGCSFKAIEIAIESGKINQGDVARYIENNIDMVVSAIPDNDLYTWTVGQETYSPEATFEGGSDNPNVYVKEFFPTIEDYTPNNNPNTISHIFNKPGIYTVKLTLTRPYGEEPETPEISTATVNIIENTLDFTASPREGVSEVDTIFRYTGPTTLVEGDASTTITELRWTFGDHNPDTLSEDDTNRNYFSHTNPDSSVSHHYNKIGTYDVTLHVTLKDSELSLKKKNFIIVKSSDEDRNSWNGGSGCFIQLSTQKEAP